VTDCQAFKLDLLSQLEILSLPMTFLLLIETALVEGNPCVRLILMIKE